MVDSDPAWINASGGAPQYSAVELRRLDAVLLFGGVADRLGARQGVRPGPAPVSLAGTTWTVHDTPAVVYPGGTSTSGPYRVALLETTGSVNAAAAQPRKDIIVAQVQDDDEDSSGQRRARPLYIAGNAAASPVEPAVPAGSFRLATIDVPASGGGSPTLTVNTPYAVAAGGILPVRVTADLPTSGLYEGMPAFDQSTDSLLIHTGAAWMPVASTKPPTQQRFTSSGTWTKPAGLKYAVVEVQAGGGAGGGAPATGVGQSSAGAGGQGGGYARSMFTAAQLGASEPVTVGAGGAGVSAAGGNSGGASSFGAAGTLVSAPGGAGGQAITANTLTGFGHGAATPHSMTGQIQIGGGGGQVGGRGGAQGCIGGGGGSSYLGTGAGGRGGPSGNGDPGKGYGGGGGGASNVESQGAKSGGAGAAGIVIVTEYY